MCDQKLLFSAQTIFSWCQINLTKYFKHTDQESSLSTLYKNLFRDSELLKIVSHEDIIFLEQDPGTTFYTNNVGHFDTDIQVEKLIKRDHGREALDLVPEA